jgi:L-ascorbate metabolism protein UlaG (beta-lactamase superfamily)
MKDFHINPAEAVKIFQLCGARHAIAHHRGTFQLTDEAIDAPPAALQNALAEAGV